MFDIGAWLILIELGLGAVSFERISQHMGSIAPEVVRAHVLNEGNSLLMSFDSSDRYMISPLN